MRIINRLLDNEKNVGPCVAVLGNFDGVHKGHTEIIKRAKKTAREQNLPLLVYTFSEHPKGALQISSKEEKEEIFSSLLVDIVYYEDFSSVCSFSPERFCSEILVGALCAKYVFCGENFRFGKGASGTPDDLVRLLSGNSRVNVVESIMYDGAPVSSTRIRECMKVGNTELVKELLGRPYFMTLPVIHGNHLGKSFGFPTINQQIPSGMALLRYGVYCCVCTIDGQKHIAVANVGTKPTVTGTGDAPVLCETHIIDFAGDLYGKTVKVEFFKKLRDEKRFANLTELSEEIKKNVNQTKEYFKNERNF